MKRRPFRVEMSLLSVIVPLLCRLASRRRTYGLQEDRYVANHANLLVVVVTGRRTAFWAEDFEAPTALASPIVRDWQAHEDAALPHVHGPVLLLS